MACFLLLSIHHPTHLSLCLSNLGASTTRLFFLKKEIPSFPTKKCELHCRTDLKKNLDLCSFCPHRDWFPTLAPICPKKCLCCVCVVWTGLQKLGIGGEGNFLFSHSFMAQPWDRSAWNQDKTPKEKIKKEADLGKERGVCGKIRMWINLCPCQARKKIGGQI